ncbi:hypothetical protein NDU88_004654 [Pleurodeles waltl]|uniref:Uncharacterized protein n=1 Tax=Pleurodeles waltl TaxID=8319 RepID=A0AAV7QDC4_PLEWA|nr:hypothetical protein NDU88_004654 [Pleurodeles waltl]
MLLSVSFPVQLSISTTELSIWSGVCLSIITYVSSPPMSAINALRILSDFVLLSPEQAVVPERLVPTTMNDLMSELSSSSISICRYDYRSHSFSLHLFAFTSLFVQ